MLANDPKVEVWAIPGQDRRQPRLLRPHEFLGAGRGPAGPRLHLLAQGRRGARRRRPARQEHRPERTEAIRQQLGLDDGDACFFVAGDPKKFYKFAGEARTRAGEELNLVDRDRFELCWIVDFPFYEYNEEEKKVDFAHNPFSMPQGGSRR
jgi:aspartyl-tRNA synthetase